MFSSESILAIFGGVSSLAAVLITSLRSRRDTSIEELQKRVKELEEDKDELARDLEASEARVEAYREASLAKDGDLYRTRAALAQHGIPDPTKKEPRP